MSKKEAAVNFGWPCVLIQPFKVSSTCKTLLVWMLNAKSWVIYLEQEHGFKGRLPVCGTGDTCGLWNISTYLRAPWRRWLSILQSRVSMGQTCLLQAQFPQHQQGSISKQLLSKRGQMSPPKRAWYRRSFRRSSCWKTFRDIPWSTSLSDV